MLVSCCGNRCDLCEQYPGRCAGCQAVKGQVAWTAQMNLKVCPFVSCAAETKVPHCGRCPDFPCELYSLSFPEEAPDEEFDRYINSRYDNFAQADPGVMPPLQQRKPSAVKVKVRRRSSTR